MTYEISEKDRTTTGMVFLPLQLKKQATFCALERQLPTTSFAPGSLSLYGLVIRSVSPGVRWKIICGATHSSHYFAGAKCPGFFIKTKGVLQYSKKNNSPKCCRYRQHSQKDSRSKRKRVYILGGAVHRRL